MDIDRCYFCDEPEAIYPCEGHKFCASCMATLLHMGKSSGTPLDVLIDYLKPHQKELKRERLYWKNAINFSEAHPSYYHIADVFQE